VVGVGGAAFGVGAVPGAVWAMRRVGFVIEASFM